MRRHPTYCVVVFATTWLAFLGRPHAHASAADLFHDNFDGGPSTAWGNEFGDWYAEGGVYGARHPARFATAISSITSLPSLSDFIIDIGVVDLDNVGVVLRSQGVQGVMLVMGGLGGTFNGLYWHDVTDAIPGEPWANSPVYNSVEIPGLLGRDASIRIVVQGDTYSAYVDGSPTPATVYSNPSYAQGSVTLFDWSPIDGVSDPRGSGFDYVRVASVPEPSTLALAATGLAALLAFGCRVLVGRFRSMRASLATGLPRHSGNTATGVVRSLACCSAVLIAGQGMCPSAKGAWVQNPSNGHFYTLTTPGDWHQAEAEAVALGGHLAAINDALEEQWVADFVVSMFAIPDYDAWIGLTDDGHEGAFTWTNGDPFGYSNWYDGEPNGGTTENFIVKYGNDSYGDRWNDRIAEGPLPGIVESLVPEPSSLALTAAGVACLLTCRSRRRAWGSLFIAEMHSTRQSPLLRLTGSPGARDSACNHHAT